MKDDISIIAKDHGDVELEESMFSELIGLVIIKVETRADVELTLFADNGFKYMMNHEQDCCEEVYIEDINGNINDLIGETIVKAWKAVSKDYCPTYTFYHVVAANGTTITIRWIGESNGYYSEEVSIYKTRWRPVCLMEV